MLDLFILLTSFSKDERMIAFGIYSMLKKIVSYHLPTICFPGEVTFKSLLFVPGAQQSEEFNKYGQKKDSIKLYVRRVFITDDFQVIDCYL